MFKIDQLHETSNFQTGSKVSLMPVFHQFRRLLKDFSFLLKVHELIIAGVCLQELTKYNEYTIPRWLWIIYCIDASLYSIIYFSIAMTHVFEMPRRLPEFTYFSLGVVSHLIGGIAGIVRSRYEDPDETVPPRSELKIGLLLLANLIVLVCEAAHMAYTEYSKMKSNVAIRDV